MVGSRRGGVPDRVYLLQIPLPQRTPSPWRRTPDGARLAKVAAAWMAGAWVGISSSWVLVGNKRPVSALRKQQRFVAVISIGFDRAEEDHMVAAVVPIDGTTLKIRDTLGKKRCASKARRPFHADKLVIGRFGEFVGQRLLRYAQHIDGEVTGVLKGSQARRIEHKGPQHQRWVQRHRSK